MADSRFPRLPDIQKSIEDFLLEEEGNITRNKILLMGSMMILMSLVLTTSVFAGHSSHSSHSSHASHESHSSGTTHSSHSSTSVPPGGSTPGTTPAVPKVTTPAVPKVTTPALSSIQVPATPESNTFAGDIPQANIVLPVLPKTPKP